MEVHKFQYYQIDREKLFNHQRPEITVIVKRVQVKYVKFKASI